MWSFIKCYLNKWSFARRRENVARAWRAARRRGRSARPLSRSPPVCKCIAPRTRTASRTSRTTRTTRTTRHTQHMPRNATLLCLALALLAAGAAHCTRLQRDREEDLAPADAAQKQKLRHIRFEKLDGLFQKLSELNAGAERPAPTTARPPEPEESEEGRDEDYEEEDDYEEPEEAPPLEGLSEEQQLDAFFNELLQQSDQWDDADVVADDPDDDWQDFNGEYQNSQPESSTRIRHEESSNVRFDRNSHLSVAAMNHFRQMTRVGKCSVPQPRFVSVQALYPQASKIYYPHCTILHKCSDDTCCCMDDYKTCVPKKTKQIHLPFFVKNLDDGSRVVENLKFENHTECGCALRTTDSTAKNERNHLPHYQATGVYHSSETETESPLTLRRCKCPSEFSVHILESGECRCNCFNRQRVCLRLKRGIEYLGLRDRLCIQNRECEQPNCEFGTYVLKAGRCPRRREQVERRLHYAGRIF